MVGEGGREENENISDVLKNQAWYELRMWSFLLFVLGVLTFTTL